MENTIEISTASGDILKVSLTHEGDRAHSCLTINGVRHHFEQIAPAALVTHYKVDNDPEYLPQSDSNGYCYILAPYSE